VVPIFEKVERVGKKKQGKEKQNPGLSGLKIKSSVCFAMEGLGLLTSPARVSLNRVFLDFLISFYGGCGFHFRL